jgi:hypothetical protein
VYRTEVRFNAVYVLESLREGDLKTGQVVYDDVIFPATAQLDGLETRFFLVGNRADLALRLADVARSVQLGGRVPIVHLEAHGTDDGLELTDGTIVPWVELAPLLGEINRASRMNLIVVVVSCMGWNLVHAMLPQDRSPLFMLIGPPEAMFAGDLLVGTKEFYRALFSTFDVNEALAAMNGSRPYDEWSLKPATAEILFCRVFRAYVDDGGSFDATPAEENELVARAVRQRSLDILGAATFREAVRRKYGDHRWWYNHLKRQFLWMDDFPERNWRFGLTYDLCFDSNRSELGAANT